MSYIIQDLENNKFYGGEYYESNNWFKDAKEALKFETKEEIYKIIGKGKTYELIGEDYDCKKESYIFRALQGKDLVLLEYIDI